LQQTDLGNSAVAGRARIGGGRVGAAVVDENDLERRMRRERGLDLARQRLNVVGLVADRDDDGKLHAGAQYTAPMSGDHHQENGHAPAHGHGHGASSSVLLGIALALTGAFMVVEFAGGVLAQSLALLADAGHMLTDTAALALAWAATRIAAR